MNLQQLSSLMVILILQPPPSYASPDSSHPLFANGTSPATVTWVRITTLDPKFRDRPCKNCANFDYDDPDDQHSNSSPPRRRRRKRRRNKKPPSDRHGWWNHRRSSGEHSRKKYSTRVRLDQPAKFASDLEEAVLLSSTTPARPTVPTPVRYLLPPFVTSELDRSQEMATSELTAGRGSTKFKDTLRDHENELDSFYSSAPFPPAATTQPTGGATKSPFRPIVVPPVADTIANSTDDSINRGSLQFVSPEVAKSGMKAINVQQPSPAYGRQQLIHQSTPPNERTVTQNEQLEHTTRMPIPFWQTTESFQPADISENYILDRSSRFQEFKNHEPSSRPTPGAFEYNLVYQPTERFVVSGAGQIRELVTSSTTTFRNEYSKQANRYPEHYSSTSAPRRPTATIGYNATSYSPPLNNSSSDSFKGLELAESSYFSELPSQGEVMKLTQTGNYRLPLQVPRGKAGKSMRPLKA